MHGDAAVSIWFLTFAVGHTCAADWHRVRISPGAFEGGRIAGLVAALICFGVDGAFATAAVDAEVEVSEMRTVGVCAARLAAVIAVT